MDEQSSQSDALRPPTIDEAMAAAERLAPFFNATPLIEAPMFNTKFGVRVFAKVDALLPPGSFKYRGALNFLLQLTDEQRAKGVVAYSTGNHAQAVALAARELGIEACIVMPKTAAKIKIANTIRYGAKIHLFDPNEEQREDVAQSYVQDGYTLAPPYDHPWIIAGQATSGLEIDAQLRQLTLSADDLVACVSGGGYIAGLCLAMKHLSPRTKLFGAAPQSISAWQDSLAAGRPQAAMRGATICDALAPARPKPGQLPWIMTKDVLSGVFGVDDKDVRAAMAALRDSFGLAVEPSAAIALAAVTANTDKFNDRVVVVTISGRNFDPQ